jgi:hypothetical protein
MFGQEWFMDNQHGREAATNWLSWHTGTRLLIDYISNMVGYNLSNNLIKPKQQ